MGELSTGACKKRRRPSLGLGTGKPRSALPHSTSSRAGAAGQRRPRAGAVRAGRASPPLGRAGPSGRQRLRCQRGAARATRREWLRQLPAGSRRLRHRWAAAPLPLPVGRCGLGPSPRWDASIRDRLVPRRRPLSLSAGCDLAGQCGLTRRSDVWAEPAASSGSPAFKSLRGTREESGEAGAHSAPP